MNQEHSTNIYLSLFNGSICPRDGFTQATYCFPTEQKQYKDLAYYRAHSKCTKTVSKYYDQNVHKHNDESDKNHSPTTIRKTLCLVFPQFKPEKTQQHPYTEKSAHKKESHYSPSTSLLYSLDFHVWFLVLLTFFPIKEEQKFIYCLGIIHSFTFSKILFGVTNKKHQK